MVRLQTKLHVKATKMLPPVGSPDPSKAQSTVGTVLSIYSRPRQPGQHHRFQIETVTG